MVFRYDTARTIKVAQDDYCDKALSGDWGSLRTQKFPESLQWRSLVDVLRGKIKVVPFYVCLVTSNI